MSSQEPAEFEYHLELLPPGRVGFRRWRWELWQGPTLLATGWRVSRPHAERALGTAASRFLHRSLGVIPLHPARASSSHGAWGGAVLVDCGAFTCRLVPRRRGEAAA